MVLASNATIAEVERNLFESAISCHDAQMVGPHLGLRPVSLTMLAAKKGGHNTIAP